MNFTFTWVMDKLGYMPKIDMQVGKVNLDVAAPDLSKPRKPAVKKTVAKKATKVAKKAK
jgi:cell division septal protein FtsQ